jgi:hypothetical protein
MKRGRRVLLILLGCGLAGVVAALVWPGEREPVYQGKKLSEWLLAYDLGFANDAERTFLNRSITEEHPAADDAIRHLGTNALPCLLRWIKYEPPLWRKKANPALLRIPVASIRQRLFEGDRLAIDAVCGFKALGSEANPAVPDLARLINDPRRTESRARAMRALMYIGREGFPPLLGVLEGRKPGRYTAAYCILGMRPHVDISRAVPVILRQDRERLKGLVAFSYVDQEISWRPLAMEPAFFVPALTNCLQHTNTDVRLEAAWVLGHLGTNALPAVPSLVVALRDSEPTVRDAATNALLEIAPDVLPRNGGP